MKKSKLLLNLLSLFSCASMMACGGNRDTCEEYVDDDETIHMFILAGQSGARGKALNKDLSDEDKEVNYDVDIYADGLTMPQLTSIPDGISETKTFEELKAGFGDSGTEFGPEIGMGKALASRFPKDGLSRKSVIVKYTACGSTFTDHWYSKSMLEDSSISSKLNTNQKRTLEDGSETGPLTKNLYTMIDNAKEMLESEDFKVVIDGVVFLHGEQDAKFDTNMEIYKSCLEYFIKDLRDYVQDEKLPFVIGEALTNSAKYSNKLRDIQLEVATNDDYSTFVDTLDLKTNTFEPWHFGAESNIILGKRVIEELVKGIDVREIESFDISSINVPLNEDYDLPRYLPVKFKNGTESYVIVDEYSSYDKTKEGEQEIEAKVKINCKYYETKIKINVLKNYALIDGEKDKTYTKQILLPSSKGDVNILKTDDGIYIQANINDNDVWTDGEAWHTGDMGQKNKNDDFRVYITNGEAKDRYTYALSAANLLRVYEAGTDFNGSSESSLLNKNLYYKKQINLSDYRVNTFGDVNGGKNTGYQLEMFISYDDLGYSSDDDIKLCFELSDISSNDEGKTKTETKYYLTKSETTNKENDNNSYFSLSDLD